MGTTNVPKVISALAARTQFGQIMRRAGQQQERFVVDKRGEPQVVIMGVKDFLRTIAPQREVLAAIRAEAKRNKKSKFTRAQIDGEIRAFRRERKLNHGAPARRP
jgi:prevent-host-death family protein